MNCPMLNLFSKCCCSGTIVCPFCVRITVVVIAILFGALLAWKPKKVIDAQTAIYRPFNWKLEPISMEKEIKNTRIMGMSVLVTGVIVLVLIMLT